MLGGIEMCVFEKDVLMPKASIQTFRLLRRKTLLDDAVALLF